MPGSSIELLTVLYDLEGPLSSTLIVPIISCSVINLGFISAPTLYPVSLEVAISEAIVSDVVSILSAYLPNS